MSAGQKDERALTSVKVIERLQPPKFVQDRARAFHHIPVALCGSASGTILDLEERGT